MRKEIKILLTAVMFYTRIPCPAWVGHDAEYLNKATRYLPVIGWIVGLVTAAVIAGATYLFPTPLSVMLGLAAGVLLTGAFHEDGFADVCDGFGGGWTKEKILTIMKDSRVGTYGVIGLILLMGIKIAVLTELLMHLPAWSFIVIMVMTHSVSRLMPIVIMSRQPYVREDEHSKARPVAKKTDTSVFIIAAGLAFAPLMLATMQVSYIMPVILIPCLIVTAWLMRYFSKWIGGYTGDCLGATQQLNEVIIYLSVAVVCKYM